MKIVAAEKHGSFPDSVFKAVIIYDDIGYAARAAALLEQAGFRANESVKWDVKSWRLDVLKEPTLAAVTNAVAANADLLVFALNGTYSPPEELLEWLDHWSANRHVEGAAMALFGSKKHADTPLRNRLERFARQRGLDFLAAHEMWTDGAWDPAVRLQRPPPVTSEIPPSLEPAFAPSHWGIND